MRRRVWLLVSLAAFGQAMAEERVRVWQEEVVLPTYPLGPEDVNPHFRELEGSILYPYTMQDHLTSERVDRIYRGWMLENDYLKLLCLPEIGGRIQYVYDKRRNEPMFYHNRVIRPGLIALRGAWVSGGIEWNRGPQGHTVTSFAPVKVVGVENNDGSASLVIGYVEKNFYTGWQVRLTLHPGRTYLDEEITLYNPTDGFHPYYFWNNTAFPNRPGTRFLFPMTLGTDHDGKNFFSWPVHEGKDLTWLRNYQEPTSIFAYRAVFDFFGAYDVERNYGIVQVADHRLLPGKKAWTWGQAEYGLVSQSVLTDEDGPYIEVQSGPLPTQADFAPLAPGDEISWREYWYPAFDLGEGFEYATRDVVVARVEREHGVELRFHATGNLGRVRVRIADDERWIHLAPEKTEAVSLPGLRDRKLDVALWSETGESILSYRSPLEIPLETPPIFEDGPRTAESLFELARDLDLRMEREKARGRYLEVLALDPDHRGASLALASLDIEAGLFEEADARLGSIAPDDGWSLFLTGVAALNRDDLERALRLGERAAAFEETRALGLGLSGRALMKMGRSADALERFRAGYDTGRDRWRLFDQILIASLAEGEKEAAVREARNAVARGSLRSVPRAVLALAGEEGGVGSFDAALAFAELGRLEEAISLLDGADADEPLLGRYYLAYWSRRLGREQASLQYLEQARALSPDYVFPSRADSLEVLEFAARETGEGKAHLLLGNLLAGLGRLDEAVESWSEAARRDPGLSVAHRNLAMASWKRREDRREAAGHFRRAIDARPSDPTLHRDLARVLLEQERAGEAVRVLEAVEERTRRADVTLLLARSYVAAERLDDAIDLLSRTTFSNREGDSGTWDLFSSAHLERGSRRVEAGRLEEALRDFDSALTYPRNLNVGRPARPREAKALFFRGKALAALGRTGEAQESFTACAGESRLDAEQTRFIDLCRKMLP